MEIKNIRELVQPILTEGQKYDSCRCRNFLAPGDNYGSIMLEVEIEITTEDGREETIHCVAKTPPRSKFLWEAFNTKVTFKKEIAIYEKVFPFLNDFGKRFGFDPLIDFVAVSKNARISLNPNSDEVDEDAVLLLENLKSQGYDLKDRFVGFDLDAAKFLLKDLATLHASVISLKSTKLEEFRTEVLPHLTKHPLMDVPEDIKSGLNARIVDGLASNSECVQHLTKLKSLISDIKEFLENPPRSDDIFMTMVHNDYWVNNTMIKYEGGKVISNRMVDFQIAEHASLSNDVLFFLYSSVELSVLEAHLDELMRFYYDTLIEVLSKFGCDLAPYSFEAIMDDFAIVGKNIQLTHILMMLLPIMTLRGKSKELTDMSLADIIVDKSSLHENYEKRMQFVVLDFVKRGWL